MRCAVSGESDTKCVTLQGQPVYTSCGNRWPVCLCVV